MIDPLRSKTRNSNDCIKDTLSECDHRQRKIVSDQDITESYCRDYIRRIIALKFLLLIHNVIVYMLFLSVAHLVASVSPYQVTRAQCTCT